MPQAGQKNGRAQESLPWEPDPEQLAIYAAVTRGQQTQAAIGKEYGVTQQYVSKLTKRVNAWLWPQRMDEIREIKAEHEQRLLHIYCEAMAAWERSKQDEVSERVKVGGQHGREKSRTRKGQAGDPRFLAEARAALEQIRRIWGADAPLAVQHTGEVRVAGMSREQAIEEQIAQMRAALVAPKEN